MKTFWLPDVVRPTHDTPSGPMTRARAKALHEKVNSLLATSDLDTTLDGLLLHTDTLCILRNVPKESCQEAEGSGKQDAGKLEDEDSRHPSRLKPAHVPDRPPSQPAPKPAWAGSHAGSPPEPADIPAGISWLPCRLPSRASRHASQPELAPMPGQRPSQPA